LHALVDVRRAHPERARDLDERDSSAHEGEEVRILDARWFRASTMRFGAMRLLWNLLPSRVGLRNLLPRVHASA
jgi:hypothetical protein